MIRLAAAVGLTAILGLAPALAAQSGASPPPVSGGGDCGAVANLPPAHFAERAVRRAESLGLLSSPLPSRRPLSLEVVARALTEARAAAAGRSSSLQRLTAGWSREFAREFPGVGEGCGQGVRVLHAEVSGGGRWSRGVAAPGWGEFPPERTGARPIDPPEGAVARAGLDLQVVPRLGVSLAPAIGAGPARLGRATVAADLGIGTLSVGRERVGYALGESGSLILSGRVALDRVEMKRDRPIRLPGWLGVLGSLSYEGFVARLAEPDTLRSPFMLGTSVTVAPASRLRLSLHRAIMFAGDEERFPTTVTQLFRTLGGGLGGLGYDNQILSGELRLRLPTDSMMPLTAYVEWGMEDAAGAWRDVPGRVVGLVTPGVPWYPPLQVGAEYTAFVHSCCGNSPWYRHWAFPAEWAQGDAPLGHPLGGNGHEWRAFADLDEPTAELHLHGDVYYRRRGEENLFVPGRVRSVGISLQSSWRVLDSVDARIAVAREMSSSWSESDVRAGITVYLK